MTLTQQTGGEQEEQQFRAHIRSVVWASPGLGVSAREGKCYGSKKELWQWVEDGLQRGRGRGRWSRSKVVPLDKWPAGNVTARVDLGSLCLGHVSGKVCGPASPPSGK